MARARSFAALATDAAAVARPLREAASGLDRPSLGLVFVSGVLARDLPSLGAQIARCWPGVPALIAAGAGVLSDKGEHEGQSAVTGLLVEGGKADLIGVPRETSPEQLGEELDRASGGKPGTLFFFTAPSSWTPGTLDDLCGPRPHVRLVGAGTSGEGPLLVDARGSSRQVEMGGLFVRGLAPPRIAISPGCKLLGPYHRVTEARGGMVLSLDGKPALDVLTRATQGLEGRPLVLGVLPPLHRSETELREAPLKGARVRPLRGVDPGRKGVLLTEPMHEGSRVAFAALDGPASRHNLEATLREMGREAAGSAARFGLYINCAGRGTQLYGNADVDSKLLRSRFDKVPFAGLMGAFELAPFDQGATMHFYSGVLALFSDPS